MRFGARNIAANLWRRRIQQAFGSSAPDFEDDEPPPDVLKEQELLGRTDHSGRRESKHSPMTWFARNNSWQTRQTYFFRRRAKLVKVRATSCLVRCHTRDERK